MYYTFYKVKLYYNNNNQLYFIYTLPGLLAGASVLKSVMQGKLLLLR